MHTKKPIEFVVSSMDENEAAEAEQEIIKKDKDYSEVIASDQKAAFEKRMMAYMTRFAELTAEQKELSAPIQELVDKEILLLTVKISFQSNNTGRNWSKLVIRAKGINGLLQFQAMEGW